MNTKILNFTPHDVVIMDENNNVICTYESVGNARVSTTQECVGKLNEVEIYTTHYGEVVGLPEETNDAFYIVSFMVKQALPQRNDLICPNTTPGQVVRNENGQIIGVKSFQI